MDAYLSANTVDKLPELTFKRCQIPGVLESICVPIDSQEAKQIKFCKSELYPNVCVPLYSPLYPDWNTAIKDQTVFQNVALNIEARFQQELTQNIFSSTFKAVSGLELTSNVDCLKWFVKFSCRYAFNLCDPDSGQVYYPCQSDCDNAFSLCGIVDGRCSSQTQYLSYLDANGGPGCSFS